MGSGGVMNEWRGRHTVASGTPGKTLSFHSLHNKRLSSTYPAVNEKDLRGRGLYKLQ